MLSISIILKRLRAGALSAGLFMFLVPDPAQGQTFLMADGAIWETCTGTFYDSGGAAGNYSSNQNMTATLCPTGGAGSGPFTSVTFTAWSIAVSDVADNLVIHNGATSAAPVLATGSGTNSLAGQTFTSTDPSGCLTFVWTSNAVLNGAGWAADINTGPDAGGNGSTTVCSDAPSFGLFSKLTGTPDPGGEWRFNGQLVSNTYTPGSSTPGVYTYTVPAVPPCVNATATVTVTQITAPDAGFDNSIQVCSSEAPFSMRSRLLGSPQTGGTWTLLGNVHINQFDPAVDVGGVYTYVVPGNPPCANDTARLTIALIQAPNAGSNGTLNICSTAAAQNLFTSLNGAPNMGGTWTKPGGTPHSGQFIPGTDPPGVYTYRVAGQSPCVDATATVTVSVQTAANPGTNADTTTCSNGASINLKNALGTTATGTWSGPSTVTSNLYNPVTMTPGTYTFTVAASGVCPATSATVDVTEILAPEAGNNGTLTVCSTGASVDLFTRLNGSPNTGGTWTAPGNVAFPTGVFVPGSSTPGTYTYTVAGTPPCANDNATVVVSQVQAVNAGNNGSLTICSNGAPANLFAQLSGGPNPGGSWFKPTPPGGLLAGSTYDPANPAHPAGVYSYVVTGTAPCPNDTATVNVVENPAPNAGTDGQLVLCNTSASVNLINSLGGTPGGGGAWLGPSNQPFPSGQFDPATNTPGIYKYIVNGLSPCAPDTGFVTVSVNQQPNAGLSGDTTVCSNGPDFQLFSVLNGTPGAGGQWSPGNGSYDPGTGQAGSYTYTLTAQAPCVSVSSTATVIENQIPNAGGNGSVTVCSTAPAFNLFGLLTGTPQPNGTWTPGNANGVFTPGTSTGGVYTYQLTGITPCPNVSATVNVTQNTAPDPGEDATVTICAGAGSLVLFDQLGGTPDAGGTWTALDNISPGTLNSGLFNYTGVAPGTYEFKYDLPPSGGCPGDHAEVEVVISATLDAGNNGSCSVCRSNPTYNLFNCLTGTPQQGGTWKRLPAGTVVPSIYNATLDPPGTYQFRYVLTGSLGCQSDSALVTITVVAAPDAGPTAATATLCSVGPPVALFSYLPGAQTGGSWKKQGQPLSFSGIYDPNGSGPNNNPGLFFYVVAGSPPCPNDTARLTVAEVTAPNAGQSANLTRCAASPAFNMTQQLGGSPSLNGTWTDPLGSPHSSTFVPGVDPGGSWTYTVPGTFPCSNGTAQLNITVIAQPTAGLDGTTNVCSDANGFPLITVLNGTPGGGGVWKDSNGNIVPSQFFDPDPAQPGQHVFRYIVPATAPCLSDTAFATIFVSKEANAGISTTVQHCPTNGALDLFEALGGTPDATGSWNNGFSGTYIPGIDTPGDYIYTVTGTPPCTNESATVTVQEVVPPYAGCNTNIQRCTSSGVIILVNALSCPPSVNNGDWYLAGQLTTGFFDPAANAPGVYSYLYVVPGSSTCPADSATLVITLYQAVDAGENGAAVFCNTGPQAPLFPYLNGTPQTGGTWRRPGGAPHTGIYNPLTDPVGNYTYRRGANGVCPADSAVVAVSRVLQPDAGGPGQAFVCSDQAAVPLLNFLSGTPQSGGAWTGPLGVHSGIYVPQFDDPGIYTYTLNGAFPCPNSSAQVNVIEYQQPNAGADGFVELCGDQPGTFPLITVLGGSPSALGTWFTESGTPFPSGVYDPGSTPDGEYTYVVTGSAPCVNDTAIALIIEYDPPDAGLSTAQQVCNTAGPLVLNDLLGGSPDAGGSWRGPGGSPHSATFDPATDLAGIYTYRVVGIDPCADDSATVTISLVSAPNAGNDGQVSACVNDDDVVLFAALGGAPQTGGTWTGTGQVNGVFNATSVPAGTYVLTYTVSGGGTCAADQSTVTVTVTDALDAGDGGGGDVCSGTVVDLFTLLTGSPQPGGIWRDLDNSSAISTDGFFNASISGLGQFSVRYVQPGSTNCPGDSVEFSINVIPGPDAGSPSTVPLCSSANQLDLTTLLGGQPDGNGQWYAPGGAPVPDLFDPGAGLGGLYTYVVPGNGGCADDSATVNIILSIAPDPGMNGALVICSNDDPADLFLSLTGTPQSGGNWTCCGNVAHSGTYVPALNNSGPYTYTVSGSGACPNASATVFVTEQNAPNAGQSNSVDRCSSTAPFDMRPLLSGAPPGGTWTDPDGAPHSQFFDPAVDSSGVYTYTVTGGSACDPATASLTVNLTYAPNAGVDSLVNVCSSDTAADLFTALGMSADSGGTWSDITGVGSAFLDGVLDASAVDLGSYQFGYALAAVGPCPGDAATLTVVVGAGLDAGVGGPDTICGGNVAYNMFNSLGGTPDQGGVWDGGSIPGALTGSSLNATLLPPGGPYQFSYTVTDPACGEASSIIDLYVATYPDPGSDTTITVCTTTNPFGLINLLGGDPDPGGTWTLLDGTPVGQTFFPSNGAGGVFRYNLPGEAPCNDTSAVLTIIVNIPPDAGADGSLLECNSDSFNLNSALGPDAQSGGIWTDLGATGWLSDSIMQLDSLTVGAYPLTYTIETPGCGTDEATWTLNVVEAVRVVDTVLTCNEVDRTYTVAITVEGGDPASYVVTGLDGGFSTQAPYVFTSGPIYTSQSFSLVVNDANDCGPRTVEGVSPCDFEEVVFVPESFTPNGDGTNDLFLIPGIEGYPGNTLDIFNRWGGMVYSAAGYDNRTVVWDGTSENALIPGDLPTGTYYYVLELGNGLEPLKGFVYLNR